MKKAVALFLVVLLASLILPVSNLLEYLTRTPSQGWSNEFILEDYDDYAMRRFFPSSIIELDGDEFIVIAFEGTKLYVSKYDAMSDLIAKTDIELGTDTVWMLDSSLIDQDTIGVYYREEKDLNYGEIDTISLQLSNATKVSEGEIGLSTTNKYAVAHDGDELRIFEEGKLIDQWHVGRIKTLGAIFDREGLNIITNVGESGSYKGVFTRYDLNTKERMDYSIFEPEESLPFGEIKDIKLTDEGTAIMYSKTQIEQGVAYGVVSFVLINDGNVVNIESYKEAAFQKAGIILDASPEKFEVITSVAMNGTVNFLKWNTRDGFRSGDKLSNTKQSGLNPKYLNFGDAEYLLWFDLTTTGKELKLSTNQEELVNISKKPTTSDYWTIPYIIILAGAVPVLITTFIPLIMVDLFLVGVGHLANKKLRKQNKNGLGLGLILGIIHVIYLALVLYLSMMKQLKGFTFGDIVVSHDLYASLIYLLLIGLSGLIALFASKKELDNKSLTWFAYFSGASTFFLTINFGIYSVIEIMSSKF